MWIVVPLALIASGLLLNAGTRDAVAATGDLTFAQCWSGRVQLGPKPPNPDPDPGPCELVPHFSNSGPHSGLDGVTSVAVSSDGTSVYAAAEEDDAVSHFTRDPDTGGLDFVACITGDTAVGPTPGSQACTTITSATLGGTNSGLNDITSIALSGDDDTLYVTSPTDDAVARFARNASTGALTYDGCLSAKTVMGACTAIPNATNNGTNSGMDNPSDVAVSPDNASVYVTAANDASVVHFSRNTTTGALTHAGCVSGDSDVTGTCTLVPAASPGGVDSGLREPTSLDVSPDGEWIDVTAHADDAVFTFDRNTSTGAITKASCYTGNTGVAGTTCDQDTATAAGQDSGIDAPLEVASGPDDTSVYVVAEEDDSILHFQRDGDGSLDREQCISGDSFTAPFPGTGACDTIPSHAFAGGNSGINNPETLTISPDGASVYIGATFDSSVVTFDRDPATGSIAYARCLTGFIGLANSGTCDPMPRAMSTDRSGLSSPNSVVMSPDGRSLYVAATSDAAVTVLDRTTAAPALSVSDVTVAEGNSGQTQATFQVTLSNPAAQVSVDVETVDGSAAAPSDYQALSTTLAIGGGVLSATVSVPVSGDTTFEGNETFQLHLSDPQGATIGDGVGTATITNDDAAGKQADVLMVDNAFLPKAATLRVGDQQSVRWTNDGNNQHNATRTGPLISFAIPVAPGTFADRNFDYPGAYAYACTLHPKMRGVIKAVPNAPLQVTVGGIASIEWANGAPPAGTGIDVQIAQPGKGFKPLYSATTTEFGDDIQLTKRGAYKIRARLRLLPGQPKAALGWATAVIRAV